jgi:hypothetical protein
MPTPLRLTPLRRFPVLGCRGPKWKFGPKALGNFHLFANSLENVLALVYTSNNQANTHSKILILIRPGAQPSNYVWHCRHLPN